VCGIGVYDPEPLKPAIECLPALNTGRRPRAYAVFANGIRVHVPMSPRLPARLAGVRVRRCAWTAVGGVVLAIVLTAAGCGGSSTRSSQKGQSAEVQPALQVLVAKMRALRVTSERYTQTTSTLVRQRSRTERFHDALIGEVGLSPDRGETFHAGPVPIPSELVIRGARFRYSSALGGCDGGRPWVRQRTGRAGIRVIGGHERIRPSRPEPPVHASLPFQAFPGERTRGGSGPFAGLINLLDTATGPVQSEGAVTVDGQNTTEFSARVDPAALLVDASETDLPVLRPSNEDLLILQQRLRTLPTQLHLFLSDSGLPVRVITSATLFGGTYSTDEQVDLLAVNAPVQVAAPPGRQVIGPRQAGEYDGLTIFGPTKPCPALTRGRRAPIGG